MFPAGLPVIALAAPDDAKSRAFIEPPRRLIIFLDLEEYGRTPRPARWPRCVSSRSRDRPRPRWLAATAIDNISASSAAMRDMAKPMILRPISQAMNQRVALGQHSLEFAFAPAAVKRCAVKLRPARVRRATSRARSLPCRRVTRPDSHAIMMTAAARPLPADPLAAWRRARADNRAGPARSPDDRGAEPRHPGDVGRRLRIHLDGRRRIRGPAVGKDPGGVADQMRRAESRGAERLRDRRDPRLGSANCHCRRPPENKHGHAAHRSPR